MQRAGRVVVDGMERGVDRHVGFVPKEAWSRSVAGVAARDRRSFR
jgi:hypothetical protein